MIQSFSVINVFQIAAVCGCQKKGFANFIRQSICSRSKEGLNDRMKIGLIFLQNSFIRTHYFGILPSVQPKLKLKKKNLGCFLYQACF